MIDRAGISRRSFIRAMALGTASLALGNCSAGKAESKEDVLKSPNRPNIIFITTDEQRWDALGCAGNKALKTPNLDRMAEEGVHFTRTYCQGPLCQPSRASILTGKYVHEHGHTWNRFDMKPGWPTMAKQLQANGYHTAVIGKTHFWARPPARSYDFRQNDFFVRKFGFDDVIEEYDKFLHIIQGVTTPYTEYLKTKGLYDTYAKEVPRFQTPEASVRDLWLGKASKLPQEHHLTSFITHTAVDWLEKYDHNKPFFLWVSYVMPHPPIIDDPTWAAYYQNKDVPFGPQHKPALPNNAWGQYLRGWIKGTEVDQITPDSLIESIRHYYGMVSLIDQGVGDLRSAVQKLGREDDTWFFFTSDHGEMLGDHGLMFKNVFYKGSVLVPNVVRPPRGMPGRSVTGLVQSIDLTATIMDITGSERSEGMRGQSLIQEMKGERNGRTVAFSEMAGHGNRGNFFVMVATDRYRYLYDRENGIHCELYDLKEDPDESHNLVDDPAFKGIRDDLHKDYYVPFLQDKIG
jgi:arylsulfatase A-like enzyme